MITGQASKEVTFANLGIFFLKREISFIIIFVCIFSYLRNLTCVDEP